jgi:hypothetical protein
VIVPGGACNAPTAAATRIIEVTKITELDRHFLVNFVIIVIFVAAAVGAPQSLGARRGYLLRRRISLWIPSKAGATSPAVGA